MGSRTKTGAVGSRTYNHAVYRGHILQQLAYISIDVRSLKFVVRIMVSMAARVSALSVPPAKDASICTVKNAHMIRSTINSKPHIFRRSIYQSLRPGPKQHGEP